MPRPPAAADNRCLHGMHPEACAYCQGAAPSGDAGRMFLYDFPRGDDTGLTRAEFGTFYGPPPMLEDLTPIEQLGASIAQASLSELVLQDPEHD